MRKGAASAAMAEASGAGPAISGMSVRRDCWADSSAMRRQRSARLGAARARCFSVRWARIGVMRATPSSVAFSTAHSKWSNLKTASSRWMGSAASASSSSCRVKLTSESETAVISARWRKPLATMSNTWPRWARRTRARWAACSPVSAARLGWPVCGDQVSAMKRRRMKGKILGARFQVLSFWDGGGDGVLVIEVDGDAGGFALVPVGLREGVVEDDHSVELRAGLDGGFAEQRRSGQRDEFGKDDKEVGEVALLDGAGGGFGVVGCGDGAGDVVNGDGDLRSEKRRVGHE